jgi:hypothetical protein
MVDKKGAKTVMNENSRAIAIIANQVFTPNGTH